MAEDNDMAGMFGDMNPFQEDEHVVFGDGAIYQNYNDMFMNPSGPVDDGNDMSDPTLGPAPDMARFGQAEQPGENSFAEFDDDWRAELPPVSYFEAALEETEGPYIQDNDQSALEQTGNIEHQGDAFESQSTGFEQQDIGIDPQRTLKAPQNASNEQRNAMKQQGSIPHTEQPQQGHLAPVSPPPAEQPGQDDLAAASRPPPVSFKIVNGVILPDQRRQWKNLNLATQWSIVHVMCSDDAPFTFDFFYTLCSAPLAPYHLATFWKIYNEERLRYDTSLKRPQYLQNTSTILTFAWAAGLQEPEPITVLPKFEPLPTFYLTPEAVGEGLAFLHSVGRDDWLQPFKNWFKNDYHKAEFYPIAVEESVAQNLCAWFWSFMRPWNRESYGVEHLEVTCREAFWFKQCARAWTAWDSCIGMYSTDEEKRTRLVRCKRAIGVALKHKESGVDDGDAALQVEFLNLMTVVEEENKRELEILQNPDALSVQQPRYQQYQQHCQHEMQLFQQFQQEQSQKLEQFQQQFKQLPQHLQQQLNAFRLQHRGPNQFQQGNIQFHQQGNLQPQQQGNFRVQQQNNLQLQHQSNLQVQQQGSLQFQQPGNLQHQNQGNLQVQSQAEPVKEAPTNTIKISGNAADKAADKSKAKAKPVGKPKVKPQPRRPKWTKDMAAKDGQTNQGGRITKDGKITKTTKAQGKIPVAGPSNIAGPSLNRHSARISARSEAQNAAYNDDDDYEEL